MGNLGLGMLQALRSKGCKSPFSALPASPALQKGLEKDAKGTQALTLTQPLALGRTRIRDPFSEFSALSLTKAKPGS